MTESVIQAFAKAYADRIVGEAFLNTIMESSGNGDEFKDCPVGESPLAISASADLGNKQIKTYNVIGKIWRKNFKLGQFQLVYMSFERLFSLS